MNADAKEKAMDAKRDNILEEMMNLVEGLVRSEEPAVPPAPMSATEENDLAGKIRCFIDEEIRTSVCACCSRRCRKQDVEGYPWSIVKERLALLDCNKEITEAEPRDALTQYAAGEDGRRIVCDLHEPDPNKPGKRQVARTVPNGTRYCLQPLAVHQPEGDDGEVVVDLCETCHTTLQKGRVPKESLVRIDTGSIPEHLKPLTIMEEALLATGRVLRYISVMRPSGDRSCQQYCYRGHLIAFPNVDINDIRSKIPLPLADIPKVMQVRQHLVSMSCPFWRRTFLFSGRLGDASKGRNEPSSFVPTSEGVRD